MADTARQGRDAVTLTATVTCHVCGTVPYATPAEADKRAEKHTRVTGHATGESRSARSGCGRRSACTAATRTRSR